VTKILANKIVSLYSIFFSKIWYLYRFERYIFEYRCPPLKERQVADGSGGRRGSESYDRKKLGPLCHSILSVLVFIGEALALTSWFRGLDQSLQSKNFLYRHDKPNELTKKGFLSFALFKSPFTSVSIPVSRGHPSLVSLLALHAHQQLLNAACTIFRYRLRG
jgi:hypothetical protein